MTEELRPYRLIIAGGRDFTDLNLLSEIMYSLGDGVLADIEIDIVSGMARGADALGYMFAHQHGIKVHEFHAQWNKYGKRAGYVRNEEMGRFADGLVAFWDGESRGTRHMIEFMKRLGKTVFVVTYQGV